MLTCKQVLIHLYIYKMHITKQGKGNSDEYIKENGVMSTHFETHGSICTSMSWPASDGALCKRHIIACLTNLDSQYHMGISNASNDICTIN